MNDKVRQTVLREHLLDNNPPVVAAVSGGADSVALLHLLVQWGVPVTAVHVHHGIRGAEADRDAAFVASLCERWAVSCVIHRADVPKLAAETKRGLEETARRIRYELLEQEAGPRRAVIATAHTLSDQTETVLLHLIRGTGSRGLCGIPYKRERIIRPLLDCTRAEIEAYCGEHGLAYVQDSTNADSTYARNRLQNIVIPEMKTINPRLEAAAERLCRRMRLQEDYMETQAAQLLESARCDDGFDTEVLRQAHPALRHTALRMLCREAQIVSDLAEHHIDAADELLTADGAVSLPGNGRAVCRSGRLTVRQQITEQPELP
ncbi:MAG: tRNA lysidine(34) synthetase TilS, partial [Clostridia bacterium]|nr:tRNA lysidine(34) synthetase TilS [Clostridia bacterium]